ncbi:hypothetical protein SBADM41S_02664 [Streptomyces badius]
MRSRTPKPPLFPPVGDNRPVTEKIVLDPDSGIAPYEQLRTQLSELARSGALPVGHRLPTVRGFAEELGLAANTVAKAYRAREADGVIETRGRNGTFVAAAGGAAEQRVATAARRTRRPPSGSASPGGRPLSLAKDAVRAASGTDLRPYHDRCAASGYCPASAHVTWLRYRRGADAPAAARTARAGSCPVSVRPLRRVPSRATAS